jgi:DNA-directed RNA polymerase subunit H (RpoH/RPB5)
MDFQVNMDRITRVCREMLQQRGYTQIQRTSDGWEARTPTRVRVRVFFFHEHKLNVALIKWLITFMRQIRCSHAILGYVDAPTSSVTKVLQTLTDLTIELFHLREWMFNITQHELVPPHEWVQNHSIPPQELAKYPTLKRSDAIARFYGFRPGNLIRIRRNEHSLYYRVVR